MDNNNNWIKLNRSILDWEWFQDSNTLQVFIYLLLKANHKDGRWQGIEVKRGQHITSLDKIASGCGLSIRQVRTCLSKLEKTQEIDKQSDKHFTLVTICKYDTYQGEDEKSDTQNDNQMTIKRQSNDNQMTTNKNNKERKEGKELSTTGGAGQTEKDFYKKDDENENQKENTSLEKECKNYFELSQVFDRIYHFFKKETLDKNADNFIRTKYFSIRNKAFTKKSGEIWDVISFSNWLVELLQKEGYEPTFKFQRPDSLNTPPTPPPFTQEELLNNPKVINQPQMVKDALITRYINASKTNFVSKNGNKMDLAMFTGFILDNIIEELGLVQKNNYGHNLPTDYSKLTDEDIFGY